MSMDHVLTQLSRETFDALPERLDRAGLSVGVPAYFVRNPNGSIDTWPLPDLSRVTLTDHGLTGGGRVTVSVPDKLTGVTCGWCGQTDSHDPSCDIGKYAAALRGFPGGHSLTDAKVQEVVENVLAIAPEIAIRVTAHPPKALYIDDNIPCTLCGQRGLHACHPVEPPPPVFGRIVSLVEYKGRLFVATETGVFVKGDDDKFVPLEFETLPPADRKPFLSESQGFGEVGDDPDFAEVDDPQDTLAGAVFSWESTARGFETHIAGSAKDLAMAREVPGIKSNSGRTVSARLGRRADQIAGFVALPCVTEPEVKPFKPAKFGEHGGR